MGSLPQYLIEHPDATDAYGKFEVTLCDVRERGLSKWRRALLESCVYGAIADPAVLSDEVRSAAGRESDHLVTMAEAGKWPTGEHLYLVLVVRSHRRVGPPALVVGACGARRCGVR